MAKWTVQGWAWDRMQRVQVSLAGTYLGLVSRREGPGPAKRPAAT